MEGFGYILEKTQKTFNSIENEILSNKNLSKLINNVKDLYNLCDKALKQIEEKLCSLKFIEKQDLINKDFFISIFNDLTIRQFVLNNATYYDISLDVCRPITHPYNLYFMLFFDKNRLGEKIYKKILDIADNYYVNANNKFNYLDRFYASILNENSFDVEFYELPNFLIKGIEAKIIDKMEDNYKFKIFSLNHGSCLRNYFVVRDFKLVDYKINYIDFKYFTIMLALSSLSNYFSLNHKLNYKERKKEFYSLINDNTKHKQLKDSIKKIMNSKLSKRNCLIELSYPFINLKFKNKDQTASIEFECNFKDAIVNLKLHKDFIIENDTENFSNYLTASFPVENFFENYKFIFPNNKSIFFNKIPIDDN